jgi:nucleoside-diphosphate-sugar epimerase
MNILITGNMGYVGPVLVREIKRRDASSRVTGLDSAYFAGCLLDKKLLPERRVDVQIYRDARDVTEDDFRGADAVICLAALSNDPMGNRYAAQTAEINHAAVRRAAELAKRAGARHFAFASSCSVYGFSESGECDESSPVNPLTEYARSKVASERSLEELADATFRVTCLRFATACGASPRIRLDLVLNDFVASALTRKKIEILSDGTPWRPLIDVKDMSAALIWASSRGGEPYALLNAGANGWNFQVRDLAKKVSEVIPGTEVCISPEGQPDKRSYRVKFDRFAEAAGNFVKIGGDIRDTINEIRGLLEASSFAEANFRDSEYMRINMLKYWESVRAVDDGLRWTI